MSKAIITVGVSASGNVTDTEVLKKLKQRAEEFNLPILKRKWDHIDLEFTSRQQKTKENIPMVEVLLNNGFTIAQISRAFNYDYSNLHSIIERHLN